MYLIDTSVVIPCLRRSSKVPYLQFLNELSEEDVPAISVITRFEIIAGTISEHLEPNRRFLDGFTQVDVHADIGDAAGLLFQEWSRKGRMLSAGDLLIGATTITQDYVLVTSNRKHFPYLAETERRVLKYRSNNNNSTSDTIYFLE